MKYVIGLLILLVGHTALAGQCRVDGGDWMDVTYGYPVGIHVPVHVTPGVGLIRLDGYRLECRYTPDPLLPSTARDYWHTWNGGLLPGPKFGSYRMGLSINGADHSTPVSSGLRVATMVNNGIGEDLRTYIYIYTKGAPSPPIDVRKGDLLGSIILKQTNNTGNPLKPVVTVNIHANNSLIVEPSMCTINGNNPLDINFNQVDVTTIGDNPTSTTIRKDVRLNYKCPDAGITLPITITLKGQPAIFNLGTLRTSNALLGVGLLRKGVLVGPDKSFTTSISNSVGGDDVTFALIRKPGTTPAAGPFTGSGTLVMGVP